MNKSKKKVIKKGWLIAVGLSSRERNKIKVYLTKKRALASKAIKGGLSKSRIIPCTITYELPKTPQK